MTATSEVAPLEPKIPSALACPEGDIFSLPTKEDIVNAFNEIAAIPGQLQAKVQEMKAEREKEIADLYKQLEEAETQEARDAIMKQIAEKENYNSEIKEVSKLKQLHHIFLIITYIILACIFLFSSRY